MTIQWYNPGATACAVGLSSDTKPTGDGVSAGATFFEVDRHRLLIYDGSDWQAFTNAVGMSDDVADVYADADAPTSLLSALLGILQLLRGDTVNDTVGLLSGGYGFPVAPLPLQATASSVAAGATQTSAICGPQVMVIAAHGGYNGQFRFLSRTPGAALAVTVPVISLETGAYLPAGTALDTTYLPRGANTTGTFLVLCRQGEFGELDASVSGSTGNLSVTFTQPWSAFGFDAVGHPGATVGTVQQSVASSTPLPLATGTNATRTSGDIVSTGRGLNLVVTLANKASTPTITPKVQGKTADGSYYDLWVAASALSANGAYVYQLSPSIVSSASQITESKVMLLPGVFRIVLTYSGSGSYDTTADVDITP